MNPGVCAGAPRLPPGRRHRRPRKAVIINVPPPRPLTGVGNRRPVAPGLHDASEQVVVQKVLGADPAPPGEAAAWTD